VPPTIGVTAKATKLKRPLRSYAIRLALRVADDVPGTKVTYSVDLRAGKNLLAYRTGATASGVAAITMRIRAPRGTRRIQIFVTASDAVGNESTATRSAKLR
jgi:hypothetical protein